MRAEVERLTDVMLAALFVRRVVRRGNPALHIIGLIDRGDSAYRDSHHRLNVFETHAIEPSHSGYFLSFLFGTTP